MHHILNSYGDMCLFLHTGEYDQNLCEAGNTTCEQCPLRLPSCIGLEDGAQPFPTKLWSSYYIQCYRNRTVAIRQCQTGTIFDPTNQACVSDVPVGMFLLPVVK